jgi:hypothetical protein
MERNLKNALTIVHQKIDRFHEFSGFRVAVCRFIDHRW